jgi:coiled-coil and C2 domain-containing protein 1
MNLFFSSILCKIYIGFGPIPTENADKSKQENAAKHQVVSPSKQTSSQTVSKEVLKPQLPTKMTEKPKVNESPQSGDNVQKQTIQSNPPKTAQRPNLKRASSTANKQLNYLLERQRLFKEAALVSKQKGDIQQAKEYLRSAKGFDPLIEATQNGLPIDATSIPTPPQMTDDFVVVSLPESSGIDDLEREEIYRKIEVELQNQIEVKV